MKIAHLILAHKNPAQLKRLINALKYPHFDIFIHLDKKADFKQFSHLISPEVSFIKKRTKIYWAAYGTIQGTLNGFEEILPLGYDYINVISAQDFPIKPASYIYEFLKKNKGKEFITCESIEDEWKEAASRVTDYHFINWQIPGRDRLGKLLTSLLPHRKFPYKYKIVGRANWFTLTTPACQFILDFIHNNPRYVRYFKYCWGADEFFFSTILYNSNFKGSIERNLVYVEWPEQVNGHPNILTASEFERLKKTNLLFARKLDLERDDSLFKLLETWIADKTNFHPL
mgnify:CR=1 FL=1